jgi:two-component system C4-dicarboxylate transport sensor histidine kinase DctB
MAHQLKSREATLHEQATLLEREITERRTAQKRLAAKQIQLEELNHSLEEHIHSAVNDLRQKDQALIHQSRLAVMGEMINNIAHQWRQPLNNIGLLVQSIESGMRSGKLEEDEVSKEIETVMDIIGYMSRTIDDFRNFFRQDKQKRVFKVEKVVSSALAFIDASLKHSNIRVELSVEETDTITGYRNEYAQVLLNILSNARDELLERKVLDPLIRIHLYSQEGRSILTIADNAGGIRDDILPRIFDPYFTTKEQGKGTGIGLYMSKVIIEQNMGGSLTVSNVEGGAEFRVEV